MNAPGWWIRPIPPCSLRARKRSCGLDAGRKGYNRRPRGGDDGRHGSSRVAGAATQALGGSVRRAIQAREVQEVSGLRAAGWCERHGRGGWRGPTQHWDRRSRPSTKDVLLFLLSTPAIRFAADDRIFKKMLTSVETQGDQTPGRERRNKVPPSPFRVRKGHKNPGTARPSKESSGEQRNQRNPAPRRRRSRGNHENRKIKAFVVETSLMGGTVFWVEQRDLSPEPGPAGCWRAKRCMNMLTI